MKRSALRYAALLGTIVAFSASAQVHRCVDKSGRVTYQQRPCEGAPIAPPEVPSSASTEIAATPAVVPAAEPPRGGAPKTPPSTFEATTAEDAMQARDVAYQIGLRDWCEQKVPGFRQQYGVTYYEWRAKNAGLMRRIERSAEHSRVRAEGKNDMAQRFADSERQAASYCNGLSSLLLAR